MIGKIYRVQSNIKCYLGTEIPVGFEFIVMRQVSPYWYSCGVYGNGHEVVLFEDHIILYCEQRLAPNPTPPLLPIGQAPTLYGIDKKWNTADVLSQLKPIKTPNCECGATAVGSDKHSDYCCLFTKY